MKKPATKSRRKFVERQFYVDGQPASVTFYVPVKLVPMQNGARYKCEFKFSGIPNWRGMRSLSCESSLSSFLLALQLVSAELSRLGERIRWVVAEDGVTGLPTTLTFAEWHGVSHVKSVRAEVDRKLTQLIVSR